MPLNIPTYTENDFSFGPGILLIGAVGATPTADLGAITEDGATLEITSEKFTITQGNPKLPVYSFAQAQGAKLSITGIEWGLTDKIPQILGAGQTTSAGGEDTFAFGGDPLVTRYALRLQHQMAVTGHTMYVDLWKAVGEAGLSVGFNADPHQFPNVYMAHRSTTDWAGVALDYRSQLFKLTRITT